MLQDFGARVQKMQRSEANTIIRFLLRTRQLQYLVDVPVIPLMSGRIAAFAAKRTGKTAHVLLSEADAELFGRLDLEAIPLHELPLEATTLLVQEGSSHLNVATLTCSQAVEYVLRASKNLMQEKTALSWSSKTWSWDQTCQWLAVFWEWIAACTFADTLLTAVRHLPLLPTTANKLCSLDEHVFFYPIQLDEPCRNVLLDLGFKFLHHSMPLSFFENRRPQLLKSASDASHLLTVLSSTSPTRFHNNTASATILRRHLSDCLTTSRTILSPAQKATLRALPIHPIVVSDSESCTNHITTSIIPPSGVIHCLSNPEALVLPVPSLSNVVFVHRTDEERRLLEQINYAAAAQEMSVKQLLGLLIEHIEEQSPAARLCVLQYLVDHRSLRSSELLDRLRTSPIVPVGNGERLLPPQDVIDPWSPIKELVPSGDPNAVFDVNSLMMSALTELGLLRHDLDVRYVEERIQFIANHADPLFAKNAARRLLRVWDTTWVGCRGLQYDPELAWIPTPQGLKRPCDTRDASRYMLYDRVLPLLDMDRDLENLKLRAALGWDKPVPLDTLLEQLRRLLAETEAQYHHHYLSALIREFGSRKLSSTQIEELTALLSSSRCVPTTDGTLKHPRFAVLNVGHRFLRGFGQIPLELQQRPGVSEFLLSIGCSDRYVST